MQNESLSERPQMLQNDDLFGSLIRLPMPEGGFRCSLLAMQRSLSCGCRRRCW
jgi:hypothetical protein